MVCSSVACTPTRTYPTLFAQNFAKTGMKAYVEIVQRKERELGTDVLTHQKVHFFGIEA